MIYDIVVTLDAETLDGTRGLANRISVLNTEKSLTGTDAIPALSTIQVWGDSTARVPAPMPAELTMPAVVFVWDSSADVQMVSQSKRFADHRFRAYYYDVEEDPVRARKFMALMQTVLIRFLDGLVDQGNVQEIKNVSFKADRWELAGRDEIVSRVSMEFTVKERDENA